MNMYILFKMFVLCYFVILTCIFFDKINVLYFTLLTAGDIELEQVPCFKYLGLHFDPVLNWKQHTEFTSKKKISQSGRG